jgi:hypothetical protein
MKILLNEQEYTLSLSALAVEKIEEKYDKALDEIFTTESKMRAKDLSFVLHSCLEEEMDLDTFKKLLSKNYSYEKTIKILNELLGADPNAQGTNATEAV